MQRGVDGIAAAEMHPPAVFARLPWRRQSNLLVELVFNAEVAAKHLNIGNACADPQAGRFVLWRKIRRWWYVKAKPSGNDLSSKAVDRCCSEFIVVSVKIGNSVICRKSVIHCRLKNASDVVLRARDESG
jgi:hypothetical protein